MSFIKRLKLHWRVAKALRADAPFHNSIPPQPTKEKWLLVFRHDHIGDYLLFRQVLRPIRDSSCFHDYKICLCINEAAALLAHQWDAPYYDELLTIKPEEVYSSPASRRATIRKLRSRYWDVLYYSPAVRDYRFDILLRSVAAREKVVVASPNIPKGYSKLLQHYNKELDALPPTTFMFYQNLGYASQLLGEKLSVPFQTEALKGEEVLRVEHNTIALFIGASAKQKRWPVSGWAEVITWLRAQGNYSILLLGGGGDRGSAGQLLEATGREGIQNLVGKTSLLQLYSILGKCRLLITNDTVAVHMAGYHSTPIVVVAKGENKNAFVPYPREIHPQHWAVFPKEGSDVRTITSAQALAAVAEALGIQP